jgi:transglutaminase-like putative cysteine protease
VASADCDISFTDAEVNDKYFTSSIPKAGDWFLMKVGWKVAGIPSAPYVVRIKIGPVTQDMPGEWLFSYRGFDLATSEPVNWSIEIDPDHVSGDSNRANNVVKGQYRPQLPKTPLEYYLPRAYKATQTVTWQFNQPSNPVSLWLAQGVPTSETCQSITAVSRPVGSRIENSQPFDRPLYVSEHLLFNGGDATTTLSALAVTRAVRSNPNLLKQITWAQIDEVPADVRRFVQAEELCQSNNAKVRNFALAALPEDYRFVLTPYATARKLFLTVVKSVRYPVGSEDRSRGDALETVIKKVSECHGFACLTAACLKVVGIPARVVGGFLEGDNAYHSWTEFYLPGAGWVPCDATHADAMDPTGSIAACFGTWAGSGGRFATQYAGDARSLHIQTAGIRDGSWASSAALTEISRVLTTRLFPVARFRLYQDPVTRALTLVDVGFGTSNAKVVPLSRIPPVAFRVALATDFDEDGYEDLIMEDSRDGSLRAWLLNASGAVSVSQPWLSPDASWRLRGLWQKAGPFGYLPLALVQNGSGTIVNHVTKSGLSFRAFEQPFRIPASAQPVAFAQIDGENDTDLVLYYPGSRRVSCVLLGGSSREITIGTAPLDYTPVCVADFDADGHPDIAFRNTSDNSTFWWKLSGSTRMNNWRERFNVASQLRFISAF